MQQLVEKCSRLSAESRAMAKNILFNAVSWMQTHWLLVPVLLDLYGK